MRAPQGLGNRGRALWAAIAKSLPQGWELDERELEILKLAARQADDVAKLEALAKRDGPMVSGSAGQKVLHPAITEARQGRLAVNRLLGEISLPDAEEEPRTAAGLRGQRAAKARWSRAGDSRRSLDRGANGSA